MRCVNHMQMMKSIFMKHLENSRNMRKRIDVFFEEIYSVSPICYLVVFIALSTITFFIQFVDSRFSIFVALVNTFRPDFAVADLMAFAYISLFFCIITTIRRWLKKSGSRRDNSKVLRSGRDK